MRKTGDLRVNRWLGCNVSDNEATERWVVAALDWARSFHSCCALHSRGFFSPSDVNDYLKQWLPDDSSSLVRSLTELSFGRPRNKGASIALVLRYADLSVDSKPESVNQEPTIDSLDFSSIMVRLGFQYGS